MQIKNHDVYPRLDYQKKQHAEWSNVPQCGIGCQLHLPTHQHHTCCAKLTMLTSFPSADEVVTMLFTDAEGVTLAELHPVMSKTHYVSKAFFTPKLDTISYPNFMALNVGNDTAPSC